MFRLPLRLNLVLFSAVVAIFLFSSQAFAATWSLTYPRPLQADDARSEYPIALLKLALSETGVNYELTPSDRILLQGKALRQLKENREINVMWSMTDAQREKDLLPIRIPIAKGLIGLRVFAINQQAAPKFTEVESLSDLLKLTATQGEEWPDTKILQSNGFTVTASNDYSESYQILQEGRADFFPRSVIEVLSELSEPGRSTQFELEQRLAIYYPSAMYFFVNRGNPILARLIETGLRRAIENGEFEQLFLQYHQSMLNQLNITERRVFKLENPLLPPKTPLDDEALWFSTVFTGNEE